MPGAVNGIVGLKPTVGLISRSGIIPISATQDTSGPMARTVKDVAILLGAMTGTDEADAATKQSEGKALTDYTKFLDANGLKGKRIGIDRNPQGNNQYMHTSLKGAGCLKKQGAEIIEIAYAGAIDGRKYESDVLKYEFKDRVNKYLASANAKVKSTEVIAFNKANEDKAMPYFKQETLEASNRKHPWRVRHIKTPISKAIYQK